MNAIAADVAEANGISDAEAWQDLRQPLGRPGSGLLRYAAAMHLRQRGLIDDTTLERYRICCRTDGEDPAAADPPPAAIRTQPSGQPADRIRGIRPAVIGEAAPAREERE